MICQNFMDAFPTDNAEHLLNYQKNQENTLEDHNNLDESLFDAFPIRSRNVEEECGPPPEESGGTSGECFCG